ncbi:hypothetical protein D9M68_605450 [compost metagenome]
MLTVFTPSSFITRCSTRLATSSLAANEVPSGNQMSTMISGRLESGKNCCCTLPMPTMPSAKISTVAPMVSQRCCTHQFTARRKLL